MQDIVVSGNAVLLAANLYLTLTYKHHENYDLSLIGFMPVHLLLPCATS